MSLSNVNFDEARQSQLPFIELLLNMGYEYISATDALAERGSESDVVLSDIACAKLMEINSYEVGGVEYMFSEKEVLDAVNDLAHVEFEGLIDTSKNIYHMIMPTSGGKTIRVSKGGRRSSVNFRYIDFENIENNVFHVSAEFTVSGKQNIRPDIVCFVNGIPFVVIENKKSSVDVIEAVNQMVRNQSAEYCPFFYTYAQLLVATNKNKLLYGTTGTSSKFYTEWKEKDVSEAEIDADISELIGKKIDGSVYSKILQDIGCISTHTQLTNRLITNQDRGVYGLFKPKRLLDLTKNKIVFDAGVKKISRYQQYFAINKIIDRVNELERTTQGNIRRRGGLVWHTQGTGKSLTMVMFVKALSEEISIPNPRVIIVTDRKDLDRQIRKTFKDCNIKKDVIRATSGQNLVDLIKEKSLAVITTLIHKFQFASKKNAGFVDDDKNIFVLIDEAHRSQSGISNYEMNRIIPNACYIGFTGTPLLKEERESWRKFGGYIDKYTIDDALADEIVVPLIYEGRYVNLEQNPEQVNRLVDRITEDLDNKEKKDLQRFVGSKVIIDNPHRVAEIGCDIKKHYETNYKGSGLKAQIVAPSKYSAILLQKSFEHIGKICSAVVISDEHKDGDESNNRKKEVVEYLNEIRNRYSSVKKYEEEVIHSFKHNNDGIEILIVVDKFLTGFDAPNNTVLYLAKDLRDHNLLQAIARVNRIFENDQDKQPKSAGYIIDYSENAKNISDAMKLFGNYDEDDIKGTLVDVKNKVQELGQNYATVHDIFNTIGTSNDDEEYLRLLEDEPKRIVFYKNLRSFIKSLNECYVLRDFAHECNHLSLYRKELKKFLELRRAASIRYADSADLSAYKNSLIKILDNHVFANEVELLTKQVAISDSSQLESVISSLGSDVSKAEAIAAQTKKIISEKYDSDPEFYESFSKKIDDILTRMKRDRLADVEALKGLKIVYQDVTNKKDDTMPDEIKSQRGCDVFFRNLKGVIDSTAISDNQFKHMVLDLFAIIKKETIIDWHKSPEVKRKIRSSIDDYLYDVIKIKNGITINDTEIDEIIQRAMRLAENNIDIFV